MADLEVGLSQFSPHEKGGSRVSSPKRSHPQGPWASSILRVMRGDGNEKEDRSRTLLTDAIITSDEWDNFDCTLRLQMQELDRLIMTVSL